MGETQERERVLSHFSRRYLQCNTNTILNEGKLYEQCVELMFITLKETPGRALALCTNWSSAPLRFRQRSHFDLCCDAAQH